MPILPPDNIDNSIVPFGYRIEIPNSMLGHKPDLVKLSSVSMGYSPSEQQATFTVWDLDSADSTTKFVGITPYTPKTGDEVVIYATEWYDTEQAIFRGFINEVSSKLSPEGKVYTCTASSAVNRLNDNSITVVYNLHDQPNRPSPFFDPETGEILNNLRPGTVYEIIKQIMAYPSAWGIDEYFKFDDIEWSGLDKSLTCGKFVPEDMAFVDRPKGDAIRDVLASAGNYKLYYDPDTEKLYVIELNLACNKCGPKWPIIFPDEATTSGDGWTAYSQNLHIKEDNTQWSIAGSANIVRLTSAPIRFYTGDYLVPEMADGTPGPVDMGPNDTVELQKARARNWDGNYYRFVQENIFDDGRDPRTYPVGMPIFPDWNIFEDWLPDYVLIGDVVPSRVPEGVDEKEYKKKYRGKVEYQPITRGQQVASGQKRLGMPTNLRQYQLWGIKIPCPSCNGSGAVQAIFSGGNNRPAIEFDWVGTGGKLPQIKVTNYIFDPLLFGDPSVTGTGGLSPFAPTQDHPSPVPWLHTCPRCRGVGWKPEYRIRNIDSHLSSNIYSNKSEEQTNGSELNVDAEFIQTEPETWEQAQNRLEGSMSAYIQFENVVTIHVPEAGMVPNDKDEDDEDEGDEEVSMTKDSKLTLAAKGKAKIIEAHPLKGMLKKLVSIAGISANSVLAYLVPPNRSTSRIYYTRIQHIPTSTPATVSNTLGQIIFQEPAFIPAKMAHSTVRMRKQGTFLLDEHGLLDDRDVLSGQNSLGFWRPAKAWIQCFYVRNDFYAFPAHETVEFTYKSADGLRFNYVARAAIVDGRWSVEVTKVEPSKWVGVSVTPALGFGNNAYPQIESSTHEDMVVETTEKDMEKMFIPPKADMKDEDLVIHKTEKGCLFPRARIFLWSKPTEGEVLYELEGQGESRAEQGLYRARVKGFKLRDDRSKMLGLAARRLETLNDVRVQGTLVLRGMLQDNSNVVEWDNPMWTVSEDIDLSRLIMDGGGSKNGLGWVNYPERGRAAVVRVTHNFDNGFTTTLELTRAEARFGETVPDDKITLQDILRDGKKDKYMRSKQNNWDSVNPPSGRGDNPNRNAVGGPR